MRPSNDVSKWREFCNFDRPISLHDHAISYVIEFVSLIRNRKKNRLKIKMIDGFFAQQKLTQCCGVRVCSISDRLLQIVISETTEKVMP